MCRQAWVAFGAQGSQCGSLPYQKGTPLSKGSFKCGVSDPCVLYGGIKEQYLGLF